MIFIVGLLFIGMIQKVPNDWDLNTKGFWANFPQTYLNNQNFVYPPWGLILLLPYYLIRAEGARVLSVLTIGWLIQRRKWPLFLFFVIVFSPHFLLTMQLSSMDILVILLPLLIWEFSYEKRWESIARGFSLSLLLVKPQCTVLILIYLLWTTRKKWKKILVELAIVGVVTIPISLIGSPPLLIQWLTNIVHPSLQNQYYWTVNNISLTSRYGLLFSLGFIIFVSVTVFFLVKAKFISWKRDQIISSLLLVSMYLLPYTSQQSFSSGLAFIPSWPGFFVQWIGIEIGHMTVGYHDNIPLWSLLIALLSLLLFSIIQRREEKKSESSVEIQPAVHDSIK